MKKYACHFVFALTFVFLFTFFYSNSVVSNATSCKHNKTTKATKYVYKDKDFHYKSIYVNCTSCKKQISQKSFKYYHTFGEKVTYKKSENNNVNKKEHKKIQTCVYCKRSVSTSEKHTRAYLSGVNDKCNKCKFK